MSNTNNTNETTWWPETLKRHEINKCLVSSLNVVPRARSSRSDADSVYRAGKGMRVLSSRVENV